MKVNGLKPKGHYWAMDWFAIDGRKLKYKRNPNKCDCPDGKSIVFTRWGYICEGEVWSTWFCTEYEDGECPGCVHDWERLLDQVRDGALKTWPKQAKFIPEPYRAEFVRAFLEGKIRHGHD